LGHRFCGVSEVAVVSGRSNDKEEILVARLSRRRAMSKRRNWPFFFLDDELFVLRVDAAGVWEKSETKPQLGLTFNEQRREIFTCRGA